MRSAVGHGRYSESVTLSGQPGIPPEYLGRWYEFRESGREFSKIVRIEKYYADNVAAMSQESDRADNPIISYKLQRSTLYTIHEIKCAFRRTIFGLI